MEYQGKSGWGHRPGWKVSNLFKNAFENMSDCFGIFSAIRDETGQIFDFEVEFVNEMAAFQCGSKREEQIGRRLLEMYPEYRTNGVFEEYCQLVENRIRYIQKPIFYYDPLNQREATRYELWAVRAGDGIAVLLRYTDEQKKIEAALYESEDAFDKTFLESEIPMTILETPDGLIMEANPAWLQLTGLEWREVADRPLMDLEIWQNAADQDKRPQTFRLGEDLNQELELRTRMAQTIYVLSSFTLINRNSQPCWLMAMVDITERKLNERAFAKKETERQMHDIITFLPDATFAIDTEGKVIAWNLLMEKLTEVKAEEILGKNSYEYSQILYGSRRPILIDLVLNYVQEIEGKYIEIIRENDTLMAEGSVVIQGKTFCLWGKASPLYDTGGKVVGAIETIRDITEIRSTEKKLRESEERYHKLIQSASDAIIFAEADTGVIIEVNQQAEKLFAMSTREITGRHISQLLPPAESDLYKKMLFSVEKGKSVFRMPKDKDLNVINRYGELTPVEISASLIEVGKKRFLREYFGI